MSKIDLWGCCEEGFSKRSRVHNGLYWEYERLEHK
jgi:hypothetical protein